MTVKEIFDIELDILKDRVEYTVRHDGLDRILTCIDYTVGMVDIFHNNDYLTDNEFEELNNQLPQLVKKIQAKY